MIRMRLYWLLFAFTSLFYIKGRSQETILKGEIVRSSDQSALKEVEISLEKTSLLVYTDDEGKFVVQGSDLPLGEQVIKIQLEGFVAKRYPVVVNDGKVLDLKVIALELDPTEQDFNIAEISLSDDQLDNERDNVSNITGLLSASKDIFYRAAAFDFSGTFFKPRGLDNEYGRVLINGISMNKLTTARPEWAVFGGLNDVKRNEVFYEGVEANPYQFGSIAGTTNSIMRASQYSKGGKVSYALSSGTYRGRIMMNYSSGLKANGWAYTILASRRFGNHGYLEGTHYDANALFVSVEKKFNEQHSLNFTGFYAPYQRGKSMPITKEVRALKSRHYNPLWGKLNGEERNSRIKRVKEPVFMLNHYWTLNSDTEINTNISTQYGKIGNTRIDNGGTRLVYGPESQKAYIGGAKNPLPDYYQNLPSYFLSGTSPDQSDFQAAYLAEQEFIENGRLNWDELYEANAISEQNGGNAVYILQEDREDDQEIQLSSQLKTTLSKRIQLESALNYRFLHHQNYAKVDDLLGASQFLDIDFYADEPKELDGLVTDIAQSDLEHPDRLVTKEDRYKYNYTIKADYLSAFAQLKATYKKADLFLATKLASTSFQRDGAYRNGYFPEHSYGKSPVMHFTDYGLKAGGLYKITGQHMLRINAAVLSEAPPVNKAYSNARQNHIPVIGLKSEEIQTADLSYIFRNPYLKARMTGYYTGFQNGTSIGYYFTQGLSGLGAAHDAAFVQEITTDISKRNLGIEFGLEAEVFTGMTLKTAGSFGQSIYTNSPNFYLTSQDFKMDWLHGTQLDFAEHHEGIPLIFGEGKTKLKNYHVGGGPERAYQIGLEYRSSDYWYLGATSNFFSKAYVDVSKLRRSANFILDTDGMPLGDYDEKEARKLLKQDKMNSYMLVNLVCGKSWRVGDYYIGFFGVLNNALNQEYRTGGFESARKGNYTNYKEDLSNPYGAQFGNRYFYGYGTNFYLNFYVRF